MTDPATQTPCRVWHIAESNEVHILLDGFHEDDVLTVIEAICRAIAAADPGDNPLGLFCHPVTAEETTLVFAHGAAERPEAIALLVEQLYVSCNNPAHIVVETDGDETVGGVLAREIENHLKAPEDGGYVAADRPRTTWAWRGPDQTVT